MNWDEIKSRTRDAAEFVGKKTEDFVSLTKLKLALSDTEREIATAMEGLGRLVYDAHRSETDITETVATATAAIDELQKKADDLREQIAVCKKLRECAECHTFNPEDASYCKACGGKLE